MRRDHVRQAERELIDIFRASTTKLEANERSAPVLEQLTRDPRFLERVLAGFVATPGALDRGHYPVVGMPIALNPWFSLVANCWIPLPGRGTNLTTKAIHHHGDMLLSTATLFGPGYEHWMFTTPKKIEGDVYAMELLEAAPHPRHHVSFVDAWIPHVPLYPRALSITLALWTSRFSTTWKDHVKRLPIFRGREASIRKAALRLKLRAADLKVVENFDFYPVERGFRVMEVRKEFDLGPNEDHVTSVFHVIQETGNEHLARSIKRALHDRRIAGARPVVERLLRRLERGEPIDGRLSAGHYDVPFANFTREDIRRALDVVRKSTRDTSALEPRDRVRDPVVEHVSR